MNVNFIHLYISIIFIFLVHITSSSARRKRKVEMCEECGIPPAVPKIMGGTKVENPEKYPWIVSFIDLNEMNIWYCGGVLISASFVLTAAHCVDNLDMRDADICKSEILPKECYRSPDSFKIGVLVRSNSDIVMRKRVKSVIPHPEYNPETNVNDIALVELKRKANCRKMTKPICLPQMDLSEMGQTLIISGWGRYNANTEGKQMLMEGTVNQIEEKECLFPTSKNRHIICARGVDSDQASCQGDSGTAIFKRDEGTSRYFAIGITSVGPENCVSTEPDSYSDIFYYMNWIKSHVKDLPLSKSEKEELEKKEKTEKKKKTGKKEKTETKEKTEEKEED